MNYYDFIIVGAGPSGLASALSVAKSGKTVLIIEKRAENAPLRPNYISVSKANLEVILSFFAPPLNDVDKSFLSKIGVLEENFNSFSQKDIALPLLPDVAIIRIKAIERFLRSQISKNCNIKISFDSEIQSVDLAEKKVITNQNAVYQYNQIIEADGSSRSLYKLLRRKLPFAKVYHPTIGHTNHLRTELLLISDREISFVDKADGYSIKYKNNRDDHYYIASFFFDINSLNKNLKKGSNAIKFQFIGEVPVDLALQDKNDINSFIYDLLVEHIFPMLKFNSCDFRLQECQRKDHPLYNFFSTQKRSYLEPTDPTRESPLRIIGDAYNNPDYRITHGLDDAFEHVKNLEKYLKSEAEEDLRPFVQLTQEKLQVLHEINEFKETFFGLGKLKEGTFTEERFIPTPKC